MLVTNTRNRSNVTDRWHRCPECGSSLRTRETVLPEVSTFRPTGEAHPNAVLTEENVRAMRSAWEEGAAVSALAEQYGVHKVTVGDIVNLRTWAHVA